MPDVSFQLFTLLDLVLSIVLGFFIGFERKQRFKEAGIRTHTIVCVGAALMTVISKNIGNGDPGRIAAQIVTGIGFLGAGMIVYKQHEVKGLTTAAGIWATAGIGMACGSRLYILAIGATLLIIIVQCVFHLPLRVFRSKKYYSVKIEFLRTGDENLKIKEIFGTDRFNHLVITRDAQGRVVYNATLTTDKEFSSTRLNEIMEENPFISLLERCDNE
ncbi:MAG: MgtC/SapB family protein [Clostridiales bacterium]|nr:MgtC/SapB family protein [Clostridiales bacterium]